MYIRRDHLRGACLLSAPATPASSRPPTRAHAQDPYRKSEGLLTPSNDFGMFPQTESLCRGF